jgi:hypothetical protein
MSESYRNSALTKVTQSRADAWLTWSLRIAGGFFVIAAGMLTGVSVWSIVGSVSTNPSRIQACDQAVSALLESREAVELQRAEILIRELNCKVSRHLPSR